MDAQHGGCPGDWVRQLQNGMLPDGINPLEELQHLASGADPVYSIAMLAHVGLPEADGIAEHHGPPIPDHCALSTDGDQAR